MLLRLLSSLIFWPLQKIDIAWRDPRISREHSNSIVLLSVIYFCQLFMYRSIDINSIFTIDPQIDFNPKIWQFYGTIAGAILAALILMLIRKKYTNLNSIKWVLGVSNTFLAISYIVYILCFNEIIANEDLLKWAKFLIGAGNATFIGLAITWICETIFRHLRTTSALYIGIWGFLGATLASLVERENNHIVIKALNYQQRFIVIFEINHCQIIYCIIPAVMLLLSILFFKKNLIKDAALVKMSYHGDKKAVSVNKMSRKEILDSNNKFINIIIRSLQKFSNSFVWKKRQLIVFSFLIGLTVQYWVFFAGHSLQFFGHGKGQFARYFGAVIGSISFILYFRNGSVRRRDTSLMIVCICSLLLSLLLLKNREYFRIEETRLGLDFLFFLTGLLSSVWIVSILFISEQFDLKFRPWLIILAPNVFRASEIILHLRTHNFIYNSSKLNIDYPDDLYEGLLLWGAMFAFIGILSGFVLKKENYEGDPLNTGVDEDGKIDEAKILRAINKIDLQSEREFFRSANKEISNHLDKEAFDLQCYLISTYFESNSKIQHTNYVANKRTFECNTLDKNYPMIKVHEISAELVADGIHDSFIEKLFKDGNQSGGLMYLPGRKDRTLKSKKFKDFELESINLEEITFKETQTRINKESIKKDFEGIYINGSGSLKEKYSEKLIQTFALFRLDAEQYAPETYFLYIVKPISNSRCTLVLKTAIELSEDNLRRLRNLISAVQARWDELAEKREFERLKALVSSSINSHFIGNLIKSLSNYLEEEANIENRKFTSNKVQSFFKDYMEMSNPVITINDEVAFLKKYLQVKALLFRPIANASIKSEIDDAISKDKIPFNWQIRASKNKKIVIPRGITQPLVENVFAHSEFKVDEFYNLNLTIDIIHLRKNDFEVEVRSISKSQPDIERMKMVAIGDKRFKRSSLYYVNDAIAKHNNRNAESLMLAFDSIDSSFKISFSLNDCKEETQDQKKNTQIISERRRGVKYKTLFIDDSEEDMNNLIGAIKKMPRIMSEINVYHKIFGNDAFKNAKNLFNDFSYPNFDLIISDLSLSYDASNKNEWSINLFSEFAELIKSKKVGVVIISSHKEAEEEVNERMERALGKHFLGFAKKTEDGISQHDLSYFLNKYYQNFKTNRKDD